MAAQPLRKPDPDHRSYTERIRELVEKDYIGAARKLLAEALEIGDHGEDLSGWQQVLAPAVSRISANKELDFDRTLELNWLKEHWKDYRGEWVALLGGELLAHSSSLAEVRAQLKSNPPARRCLIEYVE